MIKLNSLFCLCFSTIRYPQHYVTTFNLNRKLRSCISLNDLSEFTALHHREANLYGKTMVLQCFNEFPLSFSSNPLYFKSVYQFVFEMKELTLYQHQMKYANICKLLEYCTRQSNDLMNLVKKEEESILQRIKTQPFDIIDAINWILFQRSHILSELMEYSLNIICSVPIEHSESMMTKLFNSFIKRVEEVQWKNLRKYRKIFEFMVHQYEISGQSTKVIISNLSKLVGLKLHLLGYDRIPKAVDQIYSRIQAEIKILDTYHLQTAFKCFDSLPRDYNRKLFTLLFEEIMKRLPTQSYHLNNLPITHMTKEQLETFMTIYFKKSFYIKYTLYFINVQDSQLFLNSQTFLKCLMEQFFKPVQNTEPFINYMAYVCTARALLDYFESNQPQRQKIYQHLKNIHSTMIKSQDIFHKIALSSSLCGWFNTYSILLETDLLKSSKKFVIAFQNGLRLFSNKKFSSNWKHKKHYLQVRQVLKKHANSRLPQIQKYIKQLLLTDINQSNEFDSMVYPIYIYFLEESRNSSIYQDVLQKIYSSLKGENSNSFIDSYIRYPHKSYKLNSVLMVRLWSLNKDPIMMLKMIAGVQCIYFQNTLADLSPQVSSILQDASIFLKVSDMSCLSICELTNIITFCRHFIKSASILGHKLLILSVSAISSRKLELFNERENSLENYISLLVQLLNLAININLSDKDTYISRINDFLQKIQCNSTSIFILTRLNEIKLFLKKNILIDKTVINQSIETIISKVQQPALDCRFKIIIILLKLHALDQIDLQPSLLDQFIMIVKKALTEENLYPNDIKILLGTNFISQINLLDFNRIQPLKKIILHSLSSKIQQNSDYYIFYSMLAHQIRSPEIIEKCLSHLTTFPLDPPYLIKIVNLLKYYPKIYNLDMLERIIKDIQTNLSAYRDHYIDILYYINTVCYQIPTKYQNICSMILKEGQKELEEKVLSLLAEDSPHLQRIQQILTKIYRYFWITIKNKSFNVKTYSIFKLNIRYINTIFSILSTSHFEGIFSGLVYLMHTFLLSKYLQHQSLHKQVRITETPRQQVSVRSKFFHKKVKFSPPQPTPLPPQFQQFNIFMKKISQLFKKLPIRSYKLEDQLKKQKIYYKSVNKNQDTYYTFGQKMKEIQLHYNIHTTSKEYYVFITSANMKNNIGKYKGKVKLLEEIYSNILGGEIVFVEEGEIQLFFQ